MAFWKPPYKFRWTPDNRGIGTDALAFEQPGIAIQQNFNLPRYNVRGEIGPYEGGYVKLAQDVPSVSLRGDGVYLAGDLQLQALVDFERQAKNGR